MKTLQDLETCGQNEAARMDFIKATVAEHRGSKAYKIAKDAEAYYAKENITILKFQKLIMNALGQAIPDVWSSNYKLTHGFFRQFVLQQTQYVLANGVSFVDKDANTKEKLGRNFDGAISKLAKRAMVDGVSFGFWNIDHLDVFSFADTELEPGFAPLYDDASGLLCAGVRYWQPSDETYRWTLYERDGYTEYIQRPKEDMQTLREKQPYKLIGQQSDSCGIEEIQGENYPGFPIIPMFANDLKKSELIGIRPSNDCYDFIKSGMANAIDDTSVFYWTLQGTGGMEDEDVVNFVQNKLTDTIKNIDKISMLEDGDYSRTAEWEADMRGKYGRGSSYANRGKHYVRGHYSRADGKERMRSYLEDMMNDAEDDRTRAAIRRCMEEID